MNVRVRGGVNFNNKCFIYGIRRLQKDSFLRALTRKIWRDNACKLFKRRTYGNAFEMGEFWKISYFYNNRFT